MGCVEGEDGGESERDSVLPRTACHAAQNRTGSSRPRDAAALAGAVAFIADIPGELCGVGTGLLSQRFCVSISQWRLKRVPFMMAM